MANPSPWWIDALQEKKANGLHRKQSVFHSQLGALCKDVSVAETNELHDFASNDYLNLAHHPNVKQAAIGAVEKYGTGSRASALICGRSPAHVELEKKLCRFEKIEAAILFPTGYAANVGTLTALIGSEDVVYCDRLNHASIVDGCRLSKAKFRIYRQDQLERLERELKKSEGFRNRWIVTDGVFSMEGNVAPLVELCHLAKKYEAYVFVDEAHGTGVFGENGRGACEHHDVVNQVTVRVGTLSKAIGSQGGFAVGASELIDWLWNSARTQMFSTALAPAACAAASESLSLVHSEPERRHQLKRNAQLFRELLSENGMLPLGEHDSPIVPLVLHSPVAATEAAIELKSVGFLVAAIRPPTVPRGTSRLRMTVTASHEESVIRQLAAEVATIVARQRA